MCLHHIYMYISAETEFIYIPVHDAAKVSWSLNVASDFYALLYICAHQCSDVWSILIVQHTINIWCDVDLHYSVILAIYSLANQ